MVEAGLLEDALVGVEAAVRELYLMLEALMAVLLGRHQFLEMPQR